MQPLDLSFGGDDETRYGELILRGSSLSCAARSLSGGGGERGGGGEEPGSPSARAGGKRMGRADSVTFDQLNWVHSGIICEDLTGKPITAGSWNVSFPDAVGGPGLVLKVIAYSCCSPYGESLWRIPMENPYGESLLQL